MQEWKESQEQLGGQKEEWVLERQGNVKGWLRFGRWGAAGYLDLVLHPEVAREVDALLDFALSHCSGMKHVYTLVPHYNELLQRALMERDILALEEVAAVMRPIAVRVKERGLIPAGA